MDQAELIAALQAEPPEGEFRPYSYFCEESDTLTVYFKGDPDYSERHSEHVTVYLSLETKRPVGCRIKGIKGIVEDLPNYIKVDDHDKIKLSVLFLPFRGSVSDEASREMLNELAKSAGDLTLQPA